MIALDPGEIRPKQEGWLGAPAKPSPHGAWPHESHASLLHPPKPPSRDQPSVLYHSMYQASSRAARVEMSRCCSAVTSSTTLGCVHERTRIVGLDTRCGCRATERERPKNIILACEERGHADTTTHHERAERWADEALQQEARKVLEAIELARERDLQRRQRPVVRAKGRDAPAQDRVLVGIVARRRILQRLAKQAQGRRQLAQPLGVERRDACNTPKRKRRAPGAPAEASCW